MAEAGPMPWPRAANLIRQALDAVSALHATGGFICGVNPDMIRIRADQIGADGGRVAAERDRHFLGGIKSVQDVLATMREQELRGQEASANELPYVAPEVLMGGAPNPARRRLHDRRAGVPDGDRRPAVQGARRLPELIGQMLQTKPAPPAATMPDSRARRDHESDRQHAGEPLRVGGRFRPRARMNQADRRYRPDIDGLRALAVGVVLDLPRVSRATARRLRRRRRLLRHFRLSDLRDHSRAHAPGPLQLRQFLRAPHPPDFPGAGGGARCGAHRRLVSSLRRRLRAARPPRRGRRGVLSNIALWREASYFDVAADLKPLLHLWSLGVEEQFYFVWPVLLVVASRWRRGPLVATLAIGALSFLVAIWTVRIDRTPAFYAPWNRFWELLAGATLACIEADAALKAWMERCCRVDGCRTLPRQLA